MDKNTLSNYGWIVIAVLVLSVMIALATPFGEYIKAGVESTTAGLFDTSEKALNVVGMSASKPIATQLWASEWTYGKSIGNGGGSIITYSNGSISSDVNVDVGQTYVLKFVFSETTTKVLRIVYYDSDNHYISDKTFKNYSGEKTFVFTVPNNNDIVKAKLTFKVASGTGSAEKLVPTSSIMYSADELQTNGYSLAGKTLLNFGDSIASASTSNCRSYCYQITENNYMQVYNEAISGSTIRTSKPLNILKQINDSTVVSPDFVLINGLTNDAYIEIINNELGEITNDLTSTLDTTTFCGSFEATLKAAKEKWPSANIIYITTHVNENRDYNAQNTLTELALEMCEKWNVHIVDIYHNSGFNTFVDKSGTYINDGSHPNTLGYKTYYVPMIESKLKELCK